MESSGFHEVGGGWSLDWKGERYVGGGIPGEDLQSSSGSRRPPPGTFLMCWTPFFVVHITRALCPACFVPPSLVSAVTWLGYVNSALNPILYTIFNTEFRSVFRKSLHLCC